MTISTLCRRRRFPREVVAHAVWLHARLPLGLRMVEELPLERRIDAFHETVRRWGMTFGPALARELRRRAPRPGDVRHTGEVRVVIRGRVRWLWRAVDRHGVVSGETLQRRRDERAARRALTRLPKRRGRRPRRIATDRPPSCGAARRDVAPTLEHRAHEGLDDRAENRHAPLRRRERQMQGLRSPEGLPRFVPVFSAMRNLSVPPARRRFALAPRLRRLEALDARRQVAGPAARGLRRSAAPATAPGRRDIARVRPPGTGPERERHTRPSPGASVKPTPIDGAPSPIRRVRSASALVDADRAA